MPPRSLFRLACLLAVSCPPAVRAVPLSEPAGAGADFDRAVSAGLPARIVLRVEGRHEDLAIDRSLPVNVSVAGVRSGQVFVGRLGASRATMTRWNDRLDIVTGEGRRLLLPMAAVPRADVPTRARRSLFGASVSFHVFLHDDLFAGRHLARALLKPGLAYAPDEVIRAFHDGYIAWWLVDLMSNVLPNEGIDLSYDHHLAGLTDIPWGDTTLTDWNRALWAPGGPLARPGRLSFREKYLLVVPGRVSEEAYGKAYVKGFAGVASWNGPYSVAAHEFGHMLGATHDDSEVRRDGGWPCETNMVSPMVDIRSNCYAYSDANRVQIRNYLRQSQDMPSSFQAIAD